MNILVKKATDGENLSLPRRLIDCESVSKKEFWAILRLAQLFFICQIPSQGPMHKNCKTHNKLCSIVQFTTNGNLVNFSSQYIDINIFIIERNILKGRK